MTAVRVLQGGGWIIHSLQQDGVLAEPGRLAGGAPAAPLTALTPRVSQAIRAEHTWVVLLTIPTTGRGGN